MKPGILFILSMHCLLTSNFAYQEYIKPSAVKLGISKSFCPSPKIARGRAKLRGRGRIVKFVCLRDYQLIGEPFATCLRGQWDMPPPKCVKSGCLKINNLKNGMIMESYRGAVLKFICNPGYVIKGEESIYCDGSIWNGTVPTCQVGMKEPERSCDFESEDLCGWNQDTQHDFDWTRHTRATPSGHVGTGPSYDHTLGAGQSGHYMYIETSSPRLVNDSARLFSPVYSNDVSNDTTSCFKFWYHMYGFTTGYLNVYVKPVDESLRFLKPSWSKNGDQGNKWRQGIINIAPSNTPFQIIIEGIKGKAYIGDTAIDDVVITNGSDCFPASTSESPFGMVSDNIQEGVGPNAFDDTQSCRRRCHVEDAGIVKAGGEGNFDNVTSVEVPVLVSCDCHAECLEKGTCCPDYSAYCIKAMVTSIPERTTSSIKENQPKWKLPTLLSPPPLPDLPPKPFFTGMTLPSLASSPHIPDTSPPTIVVSTEISKVSFSISSATSELSSSASTSELPQSSFEVSTSSFGSSTFKKEITTDHLQEQFSSATSTPNLIIDLNNSDESLNTTSHHTSSIPPDTQKRTAVKDSPEEDTTASIQLLSHASTKPSVIYKAPTFKKKTTPFYINKIPFPFPKQNRTSIPVKKYFPTNPNGKNQENSTPKTWDFPREWQRGKKGLSWESAQPVSYAKDTKSSQLTQVLGITGAVMVSMIAASVSVFVLVKRRRRERRQSGVSDDSDVRFLTSDELLDFNIATPQD